MNRFFARLAVIIVLLTAPGFAHAGRMLPEPLLVQMDQGYGVIAAVITKVTVAPKDRETGPTLYDVQFKVHEVYAQPVTGDSFPLKKDDSFDVRVSVGYACLIEIFGVGGMDGADRKDGPLGIGKKYLLVVNYDQKDKVYAHAPGASALHAVKEFTREGKSLIQSAREVAATPLPERLRKFRALAADSSAGMDLRFHALAALQWRLWHEKDDEIERKEIARALLNVWNDKNNKESNDFMISLDYTLRTADPSFDKSEAREDVWLARIFAPIVVEEREARKKIGDKRGGLADWTLTDFGRAHPKKIGDRLVKELANSDWPVELTCPVARALQTIYEVFPEANATWEQALQNYYPPAIDRADAWVLRMLASDVSPGAGLKRHLHPGPMIKKACEKAFVRMRKEAENSKDEFTKWNANAAIHDLEDLLKSFKDQ